MPVKIINDIPDPKVVKNIVCKHCGVTLEYVPIDVKRRDGKDYTGGADGETWVDCPNCNGKAIIRSW